MNRFAMGAIPTIFACAALIGAVLLLARFSASEGRASSGEDEADYDFLHTVAVQLGDQANRMRFFPGRITLTRGESYKLVLTNPAAVTHEFASETLAQYIETDKLEIFGRSGELVAYVRGRVDEVELLPGGRIEWMFTATRAGEAIDLFCDIPGHRDAGMVGEIRIVEKP